MMALLLDLWPKILIAVGIIGGTLALWLGVRRSGVQKQILMDAQTAAKDAEIRRDVDTEVSRESDAAVADDLRRQRHE